MKRKIVLTLFWLIYIVVALNGCTVSPEDAFKKAAKSDSITAYREFLKKYPQSTLSSKAQTRIQELTNDLFVAGIRKICYSEAVGDQLSPWDKILQDDNTNILALAMKGSAEAKSGNFMGAKAIFETCSQLAYDTPIAPYLMMLNAGKNTRTIQLACPLPASVTKNAVLYSPWFNQFEYTDPNASRYSVGLFGNQAGVFLWKVPNESTKDIIRKIMENNIKELQK